MENKIILEGFFHNGKFEADVHDGEPNSDAICSLIMPSSADLLIVSKLVGVFQESITGVINQGITEDLPGERIDPVEECPSKGILDEDRPDELPT